MNDLLKRLAFIPRQLSAGARPLPDFILIGAQKGGSSALYKFICAHPDVVRAFVKEPHYFSGKFHDKSVSWYKAQFPIKSAGKLVGEASPSYCTHPLAPQRIKALVPKAKLLFIVRNPVDRAVSNYFHSKRYGSELLEIEDAFKRPLSDFDAEYEKMAATDGYHSDTYNRFGYVHKGLYAFHLKKWYEHFSPEQILIVENEELQTQPDKVYAEVRNFLGLSEWIPEAFSKHNVGKTKEIPTNIKAQLSAMFKEPNQAFFDLIGRSYPWQ